MSDASRRTVLLVEDEHLIARSDRLELECRGYEVIAACTREKALEASMAYPQIDLMLVDLVLGGGEDGVETALAVLLNRDIPMLFLTDRADQASLGKSERVASFGYVDRSAGFDILDGSIRTALRLFEERRRTRELDEGRIALLSSIIESLPEPVFAKDSRGIYVLTNAAGAALIGRPMEEIIGKTAMDLFAPEVAEDIAAHDREVMESRTPRILEERAAVNGRECLFSIDKSPWLDAAGSMAGVVDVSHEITELRKAEGAQRELIEEKELLLREVHHRVKNNMATMKSLLNLQAKTMRDPRGVAALTEAQNRLDSMMLIYEKLYESGNYRELSVKAYVEDLLALLFPRTAASSGISIECCVEDFMLDTKKLQPLAIILNELVTNILKYAFVGRESGRIALGLASQDGHVTLEIRDDGSGLPDSVDFERSPGFGLTLVKMLASQLDGSLRIERGRGTTIVLEFDQ